MSFNTVQCLIAIYTETIFKTTNKENCFCSKPRMDAANFLLSNREGGGEKDARPQDSTAQHHAMR